MTVSNIHLVYPMIAMFCLSLVVLIKMFLARVRAIKTGQIKAGYFKTYSQGEEPEHLIKVSRHFSNLFEAPVLFYVACILGLILPVQSLFFLVLAWLYVAARAAHAYIHIGPNKLLFRMGAYGIGWLFLTFMWVLILLKVLTISTIQ